MTQERDSLEKLISQDPLWAAEELVQIKRELETISNLAHEDGSRLAHRALQSLIWK